MKRDSNSTKTSELQGPALDWAVAKCEVGAEFIGEIDDPHFYSSDWAQGGPIIEREEIGLNAENGEWYADCYSPRDIVHCQCYGPTPLVAAMRCFVASRLGAEVEIPEELQ